ncbi:MAG TPA: DNA/RNA non-specific endonuclease [Gemmatimonadaceae bacterium]|nr:DNA/RNA non-specific endonuclease [Gemmatimonadaceae bacterium]
MTSAHSRPASRSLRAFTLLTAAAALSCGEGPTEPHAGATRFAGVPAALTLPAVRFSEIHYDNAGTDVGEAIEVSGPAGQDLTGWSVVLYNGSGGASYGTTTFTAANGIIPATCGARGVLVVTYPANGIQNGSPDGMALVDASNTVVEFLSYEGTFTATNGAANGMLSTDIGVSEAGTEPAGQSLQRSADGTWTGPVASTFGACNDAGGATPVVASVTVAPASASVAVGATQQFTATALDATNAPISGVTFTWTSTAAATVSGTGLATGASVGSATITATAPNGVAGTASLAVTAAGPTVNPGDLVISQAYGGGGNSGATYKNDFIEIFNRGTSPVTVNGWSVQHASATGTSWSVTPIAGTIPAGGYYLVQESQGSGGTADLPAPDATGTITMGATSGKDLIATTTAAQSGACPSGAQVIDVIGYGSGANCGNAAAAPSNTTGVLRRHNGCTWTPDPSLDLVVGAPAPRNSASPVHSCVAGPLDHVNVTGTLQVLVGATTQLAAEALDAGDNTIPGATITWSSGDDATATVSAWGLVTGVAANATPVAITATATAGGVTKVGTVNVQVNNPGINWIDISSSSASLPPGFQTQLFATARDAQGGTVIPATFHFEAADPQYATVEDKVQTGGSNPGGNTGILTGVAAPTDGSKPGIRVTATPIGGGTPYTFVAHPVTIEPPNPASPSIYGVNDAFGDPTPASGSTPDDFLIRRDQYTLSYNQSRGTPNWVAYELDSRQIVPGQDRCNCFTADPLLPAAKQVFTSDYTNGGYDRGHMTRSFDRTAGNVDNAITFYLTNVVPQQGDLNQGVWAQFENALGDSATAGRAVYIVTGPLYSRSHGLTFLKGEDKVAIPDSTWKVALIGPRNGGNPFTTGDVQSFDDLAGLTLLAVNMPNIAGVRNDPWSKYLTTVDQIEAATGYDILSLLKTGFQAALDYKDHKPAAQFSVTGTPNEGQALTFDASASSDADIGRGDLGGRTEALTYAWHFSDGTDATGPVVTRTFANSGSVSATLTVTDVFGWPATRTQALTIANVAPTASFAAPASGVERTFFAIGLSGAHDPSPLDEESLVFAFDCGSGYGAPSGVPTATCAASAAGPVTVRGKVIDPDGGFTEYASVVNVTGVNYAIVRHAPVMNASLDGSLQMLLGESVTFNGNASVSQSLYVPGVPAVRLNGRPALGATSDWTGAATPTNYTLTLNGGAALGALVRKTDPVAMPVVAPPQAPAGTRSVNLNRATDAVGDWATVRNLTLNGSNIVVAMPAGAYGNVTLNGNNRIVIGVPGAATPAVYDLQQLTLNGSSSIEVAGPVVVTLANGVSLNGSINANGNAEWLTFRVAQGGVTLNGNVSVNGTVIAPNGTVTINGGSALAGGLAADRLTLNGNALLRVTLPVTP